MRRSLISGLVICPNRCSSFGSCTSLRPADTSRADWPFNRCSSFGSCTSLRRLGEDRRAVVDGLQFLRELHFIEAQRTPHGPPHPGRCSSFGSCTSLRPCCFTATTAPSSRCSSFGSCTSLRLAVVWATRVPERVLQFLRELHFIEADCRRPTRSRVRCRSSFGNCTSLRPDRRG